MLKEYAQRDRLDRRDAALATRLCYGVLQNRMLLDFYLSQLVRGRLRICSRWCWTFCAWACIRFSIWIKSRLRRRP
ncbi:MAG: hypothetical protein ACLSHU_08355 [Oscillospiraceae bacterium]